MKCDWWKLRPGETCDQEGSCSVEKIDLCIEHFGQYANPPRRHRRGRLLGTHVIHFCREWDGKHALEVYDVGYYCSSGCMYDTLADLGLRETNVSGEAKLSPGCGALSWGEWPSGSETDCDVYCGNSGCGVFMWHGLR
ncbi:hypothetical protein LCGC14_2666010, partial [marine sediment metagenome]